MLGFQCFCLMVTLFVLYIYVESGISTRAHRLLPLFLGLIATFNFCQVLECVIGATDIFMRLQDVLLLQVLYVLLHYVMDFCYIRLPKTISIFLDVVIMARNIIIFIPMEETERYRAYFLRFAFLYMVIILAIGIYAIVRQSLTRRDHRVAHMMYIALLPPIVALQLRNLMYLKGDVILPTLLVFTCSIIFYLIETGQLADTTSFLQENLYDNSDIAMVFFDSKRYYLAANQAAHDLFPQELPRYPRRKGKHPYRKKIEDLLYLPEHSIEIEQNGKYYRCQLQKAEQNGSLRGYVLSIVNISKQKQELQQMEQLKKEAETQTQLKGKFLASISHDLRSPLHAIIGLSDGLLVKKELSAKNRASVRQIKTSSRGLLKLVNDVLEYSKLEAGKIELTHQPYNLEKLLKEVAQVSLVNLQERPIDFRIEFITDYPEILIGDELRMREIFQNLFSNAVKYTKEGSICCEVRCKRRNEQEIWLECKVIDTGIGMTQEQLARVFGEYESFSEKQGGIGLGLSIVRQLAEEMEGTVSAFSDGISGSTFAVKVVQEIGETIWNLPQRFTKNVLLAPWKVQLDTVKSGEAVIEAVKNKNYHVIFLDQMMPGMTGMETADAIRGAGITTPLVLMTADVSDQTRKECQRRGFQAFLGKPLSMNKLKQTLEQYLPQEGREPIRDAWINGEQKIYRRMLEAVKKELSELVDKLAQYAFDDMEMFRVKVHGIKGFCKQISKLSLAKNAEIMEMAAKTENTDFITTWLPDFIAEIGETIEEITKELSLLPKETMELPKEYLGRSKEELFAALKQGFDSYNLKQIEEQLTVLEALPEGELKEEEQELFEKAKAACEELDYELGSSLF